MVVNGAKGFNFAHMNVLHSMFCYFTQGGMKAVVWTDVFQSVVMIAGLLAIMIQVLIFTLLSR